MFIFLYSEKEKSEEKNNQKEQNNYDLAIEHKLEHKYNCMSNFNL